LSIGRQNICRRNNPVRRKLGIGRRSNICGQHVSDDECVGRGDDRVCTHAVQVATIKVVETLGVSGATDVSGATVGLLRRRSAASHCHQPKYGDQLKCDSA